MMNDIATIIGAFCTSAALVGGLAVWAFRSTVAPLNVVIDNNTKALDRITVILDDHSDKLEDHGNRITKIETKHEMEDRI